MWFFTAPLVIAKLKIRTFLLGQERYFLRVRLTIRVITVQSIVKKEIIYVTTGTSSLLNYSATGYIALLAL